LMEELTGRRYIGMFEQAGAGLHYTAGT
jgi:hypothetical protein